MTWGKLKGMIGVLGFDLKCIAPLESAPGPVGGLTWGESLAALAAAGQLIRPPYELEALGPTGEVVPLASCVYGRITDDKLVRVQPRGDLVSMPKGKRESWEGVGWPAWRVLESFFDGSPKKIMHPKTGEMLLHPVTHAVGFEMPDLGHQDAWAWTLTHERHRDLPDVLAWRLTVGGETLVVGDALISHCLGALLGRNAIMETLRAMPETERRRGLYYAVHMAVPQDPIEQQQRSSLLQGNSPSLFLADDLLPETMPELTRQLLMSMYGQPPVLSVHDEVLVENAWCDLPEETLAELNRLMDDDA